MPASAAKKKQEQMKKNEFPNLKKMYSVLIQNDKTLVIFKYSVFAKKMSTIQRLLSRVSQTVCREKAVYREVLKCIFILKVHSSYSWVLKKKIGNLQYKASLIALNRIITS